MVVYFDFDGWPLMKNEPDEVISNFTMVEGLHMKQTLP